MQSMNQFNCWCWCWGWCVQAGAHACRGVWLWFALAVSHTEAAFGIVSSYLAAFTPLCYIGKRSVSTPFFSEWGVANEMCPRAVHRFTNGGALNKIKIKNQHVSSPKAMVDYISGIHIFVSSRTSGRVVGTMSSTRPMRWPHGVEGQIGCPILVNSSYSGSHKSS
jgi:hypothetical protein